MANITMLVILLRVRREFICLMPAPYRAWIR